MILTLLRPFLPYIGVAIAAFGTGWSAAWYVQGSRLTACKQDHVAYVQKLEQDRIEAEKQSELRRKETSDAWAKNLDYLRKCYASGKCLPIKPSGAGISTPIGANDSPAIDVPAPERIAEDCAITTLQLMTLQNDIKAQKGY